MNARAALILATGLAAGGHALARSVDAQRRAVDRAATLATGKPASLNGFGSGPSPHLLPLEVAAS